MRNARANTRATPAILLAVLFGLPGGPDASCPRAVAAAVSPAELLSRVQEDEARRVALLERIIPATVCIFPRLDLEGGGSGVLISPDGLGISNFHVVADFLTTRRGFGALCDGRIYPLQVLGIDPGGDIVLFQMEGRSDFPWAPLGDSDALRVGQWVAAIGNPFLLAEDYVPTVSVGIISGLHRYQEGQGNLLEYADCIQVSTSINPGNSGGPLFDQQGRVIGINGRASFEERGRVNVGLGYAVTINQVRRFLPGLRAGLLCEHGTLGATVASSGATSAAPPGKTSGVIFNAIQQLSPAERAGIRLGDELLTVNGRTIRTPNDFNNAISILPADWPTTLLIRRGDERLALVARLERLPARLDAPYVPNRSINVAEQRRLLEQFARTSLGVSWRDWVRDAAERGPAPIPAAGPAPDDPEAAAAAEVLRALLEPLWNGTLLDARTHAIGGDEVSGRLAAVLERRGEAQRLRWKFDWETGAWLGAAAGDAEQPERVTITFEGLQLYGRAQLPARWIIRDSAGKAVVVELAGR